MGKKFAATFALIAVSALVSGCTSSPEPATSPAPTVTAEIPAPTVTVTATPPVPTEWTTELLWQECSTFAAQPGFAWFGPDRAETTDEGERWLVTIHGAAAANDSVVTALIDCYITGTPDAPTVEYANIRD